MFVSEGGETISFNFFLRKKPDNYGEGYQGYFDIKVFIAATFADPNKQSKGTPDITWKGEFISEFHLSTDIGEGVETSVSGRMLLVRVLKPNCVADQPDKNIRNQRKKVNEYGRGS